MPSPFFLYIFNRNYIIPSARSFCCHFQAEAKTSSSLASAFQPKTLLALVQSPQIFSISPSRRGPYFQFNFTPVAFSNVSTISRVELPLPVPIVEGIHSRTDFDLSQHQQYSGKKIQYFDTELNESYVPYVIETSIGVDRMFLQIMSAAYCEEDLSKDGKQDSRVVLRLPAALAPVKMAIMPLVKKDGLPEKAQEIMNLLKYDFNCQYDEKDSIGKRYRRQDAIGTPFCITVDHQTLKDHAVTIRDRDTMQQERVAIDQLFGILKEKCDMQTLLRKMTE